MEAIDDNDQTCSAVGLVKTGNASGVTGIIIDEVQEVHDIMKEEIDDPPSFEIAVSVELMWVSEIQTITLSYCLIVIGLCYVMN